MDDRGSSKPAHLLKEWLVAPINAPLTRREREILALLESELSVREMAEQMVLAVSTTKWYIQQIYGKLGVNNRRQAMARARELGLLQAESPNSAELPPLRSLERPQHNLPVQLTSFIGREKEIGEVKGLVRDHRLVTLTGPGGSGKTRLSLEVGKSLFETFPDGVWFVDLTHLSDPALIPGSLLAALDLRIAKGSGAAREEMSLLIRGLQVKSALLILDNCEYLVEACASVTIELLQACPDLHILTTSREVLNAAGEEAYPVPPLDLPDPKHLPPLEELSRIEAVRLFVDRARSAGRDFELAEHNARAVAHVCQRLDGIPLAIELAAARVKVMTPGQIAERLDDVFRLLAAGSRTALPRHQTLRKAIEWSYNLLSEQEKVFFCRLAVFSGGWSLEAAEAICAGEGIEPFEVLDLLSKLVDKSLVLKEEKGGQARFRMLETIHQYAVFQLYAVEAEVEVMKNRHRDWFLELVEKPPQVVNDEISWADLLEGEHDNLRAALAWSIEQKHRQQLMRLVIGLGGFWNLHSHDHEGYRWTEQALRLIEEDPLLRRSSGWGMAVIKLFPHVLTTNRDIAAILPRMEEACAILRQEGKGYETSYALRELGIAEANLGLWESAERHFREALAIQEGFPPDANTGFLLLCLGVAAAARGDYTACRDFYCKSLDTYRLQGDRCSAVYTYIFQAEDFYLQGNLPAAREFGLLAVECTELAGMSNSRKRCLHHMGRIYLAEGDFVRAREWAWKAFQIEDEHGGIDSLVYLAEIDLHEGQLEGAEAKATEARNWAGAGNKSYALMNTGFFADLMLGRTALLRLDMDSARSYLDQAERQYNETIWFKDDLFYLLAPALAHAARLEGRFSEARRLYADSLRRMHAVQHFLYAPESLEGLAMLELETSQGSSAARLFGAAQALRERMGTPLPPFRQAEYLNSMQRLRQALTEADFEQSWSDGRGMTVESFLISA